MADPEDMILPLLRDMRAENSARHDQTLEKFTAIEKRLDKIEQAQVTYRQALSADSLFSKLVTGEFEQRIEALENRMRELEGHK